MPVRALGLDQSLSAERYTCMCGIVGILGREPVAGALVDALKRLEYRGYDSAGVATLEDGQLDAAARRGQAAQS